MSYVFSRVMSAATAAYGGFCLVRPEHLGEALGVTGDEQAGFDLLAEVFGVRDLAISSLGVLGRSDRTVRAAMWMRIACDLGDGIVLARRLDEDARAKAIGAAWAWGALNLAALRLDSRRAARSAPASR